MPVFRVALSAVLCLAIAGCRAPERIDAAPCLAALAEQPMGPRLETALEEIAATAGLERRESQPGQWQFVRSDGSVAVSYQRADATSGGVLAVFRAAGTEPETKAELTLRSEIGEFPLWFPGILACSKVPGLTPPVQLVD